MQFNVSPLAKIDRLGLAKQAEDAGYDSFGAGEGPLLFSEPYQYLAVAAQTTERIQLGPWVTNPLTRLAPQTANAIATLNALAPGRVFLGIGTANNAMRSMGMRPARLAELADAVQVIRRLLAGERALYELLGQERYIEFLDPEGGWYNIQTPIPIYIAAGGPKSIELAGRLADGVIYCLGPDPRLIRLVRQQIDAAAARAGRDPQSIKLIGLTWTYVLRPGEDFEEAITQGFGSGPLSSGMTDRELIRQQADQLAPSLVEAAERATSAFFGGDGDPQTAHLDVWKSYLKGLDPRQKPYITRALVDAFCVWGTPDQCLEKAHQMAEAGVDLLSVFLANPYTYERDIDDFADAVIRRW